MKTTMSVRTIFHCSLERAFKTPMLCDITQVHTGFLVMPRVTHCEGDENWGKPGFSKKVFLAKTLMFKGGEASKDTVIERMENEYWKIEVNDFKVWMLGFSRFVGEWRTTELAPNEIQIDYTYTMHSDSVLLYPLNWLFTNFFLAHLHETSVGEYPPLGEFECSVSACMRHRDKRSYGQFAQGLRGIVRSDDTLVGDHESVFEAQPKCGRTDETRMRGAIRNLAWRKEV